jgi:NADH-quinone oxidoreductase subunit G
MGSGLDDIAAQTLHAAPDDIARLGFQIAHEIDPGSSPVLDLPEELKRLAARIGAVLKSSKRPLTVSGTSCGALSVIQAAANIAWALSREGRTAALSYTLPECDTFGLGLIGGLSIRDCFEKVLSGQADSLIILENDLFRRAETHLVQGVLAKCKHVVVIDHILNGTGKEADLMLPAVTFAETTGTLVSSEGRCQRQFSVMPAAGQTQESYRWISEVMTALGRDCAPNFSTIENITSEIAQEFPIFKDLADVSPPANFRVGGQKIPRQPHRYSGRTAMRANISVHEPKPTDDLESPLSFSMEGYPGIPPASVNPRFWAPSWNSCQAVNKFQKEISGPSIGGDSGKRLIEPSTADNGAYFREVPKPFKFDNIEWLVIQSFHIFGSEELSSRGDSIAQRIPHPYVGLNGHDAASLGKDNGHVAQLIIGYASIKLPVRIIPTLCTGVIALPVGIPGLEGVSLPAMGKIIED